jgi:hypothetical protein
LVRPEWSKGWGYGTGGAWSDRKMFNQRIPSSYRRKGSKQSDFTKATATLEKLDPHRLFTSPLVRQLMPRG